MLADRPRREIFVAWYAHTEMGRVAGIRVRPTKAKVDDGTTWQRAIEWATADFGFRACPIFRVDMLGASVELGPLCCYTKDADACTILAECKRQSQLHPDAPEPSTLLPATAAVSWVWSSSKCHAIGQETSVYRLQEVPEIAQGRTVSTLSVRILQV